MGVVVFEGRVYVPNNASLKQLVLEEEENP